MTSITFNLDEHGISLFREPLMSYDDILEVSDVCITDGLYDPQTKKVRDNYGFRIYMKNGGCNIQSVGCKKHAENARQEFMQQWKENIKI
jgi:hypothetical protein